ncbi:hypothetical protein CBS101457_000407 [Exobasidium rhododendri]|nr:hypothetical protein CBS101457_000407 [Exobasidium rhododendri]
MSISELAAHVNHVHLAGFGQIPNVRPIDIVEEEREKTTAIQWTQDQAWKCLWDSCQVERSDAGMGMDDSNLILQHIMQAHVCMGDDSLTEVGGRKRKRRAGEREKKENLLSHNDTSPSQDCGCPVPSNGTVAAEHPCEWIGCSLRFTCHLDLTLHINKDHIGSGKSDYECHWKGCTRGPSRKFNQKQKILRHLQTHTGHRPFECEICQKRFSEANTLCQHRRTHTNEKPYRCDEPGCNKSFAVAGSLTIHKRIHTGEKPFQCSWPGCPRAFSESSNLTKHLRTHTGEKPFSCPFSGCSKTFSRPDQVARHKKTHYKDGHHNAAEQP